MIKSQQIVSFRELQSLVESRHERYHIMGGCSRDISLEELLGLTFLDVYQLICAGLLCMKFDDGTPEEEYETPVWIRKCVS